MDRVEVSKLQSHELVASLSVRPLLRTGDRVHALSPSSEACWVERRPPARPLLLVRMAGAGELKASVSCPEGLVRAAVVETSAPTRLLISGNAIRRYFYRLDGGPNSASLYDVLGVAPSVTPRDLRMALRLQLVQAEIQEGKPHARRAIERAFNIVADPVLAACYQALQADEEALPLFPYGGFGWILVEGRFSQDHSVFYANHILAYQPDMICRTLTLPLRRLQFLPDRALFRDTRRGVELWLDYGQLGDVGWDATGNPWKPWLKARVKVTATFVKTGRYRREQGAWVLRTGWTALPSRVQTSPPEGIVTDVERAKTLHELLGQGATEIDTVRCEVNRSPVEQGVVQGWFDQWGVCPRLKPQHVIWRPDYEEYYFEPLRRRATMWFLFRDEYLFVLPRAVISEVPQSGNATYLFASPQDLDLFLQRYAQVSRNDILHNRGNVATALGFVGRVVHGAMKKRWLRDVLTAAREPVPAMADDES